MPIFIIDGGCGIGKREITGGNDMGREGRSPFVSLGELLEDVESALAGIGQQDLVGRIWRRDHTVWKPDPSEIADRLGWLNVTDTMRRQVPTLDEFASEIRDAGTRHAVLLGMGGSSLGPEVLRQTFGSREGCPELIVLDSTVPAWVRSVTEAIDPAHTLFLVSSKSGSTIEPLFFYVHFRSLVEEAVGREKAGRNFIAITDAGTPLEKLAREQGFRRAFLNPPDIGGRYSVLSYFGLVPAALMGLDVNRLLDRADRMKEGCASHVPAHENSGAWLGAVIGSLALKGRDKLTLVTSPSIESFGLWVEQLLAESTGKENTGIIPVAGEPLTHLEGPHRGGTGPYGRDRLFIYLRLEGDDNTSADAAIEGLRSSGQPVARLDMGDKHDLGAEFFRWEFATAVAGSVLGIHPFDQPDVQGAKDMTDSVLQEYRASGSLLPVGRQGEAGVSVTDLLSQARPGDYLAIMAYLHGTTGVDEALAYLRRVVLEKYNLATTLGYGPRFLHSTGQLHKGGPDTGLYLQLTADHYRDLPIPGQPYTFGTLADAQAMGDLRALQSVGRRVARLHLSPGLGHDLPASIRKLAGEIA
jgi:glucose-6-phosphate isomerase/transaldolase/glucose-6-phosphate isomerase